MCCDEFVLLNFDFPILEKKRRNRKMKVLIIIVEIIHIVTSFGGWVVSETATRCAFWGNNENPGLFSLC